MLKFKFKPLSRALAAVAVALGLSGIPARAEIEAYMRLGIPSGKTRPVGTDIIDTSVAATDGWFPITFTSHSITAASSWTKGGGASVGKPNPGDFTFIKNVDFASASLLSAITTGRSFASAELVVRNPQDPTGPFYAVKLQSLFVVQLTPSASAGDPRAIENVSVIYRAIEWSYHNLGSKGEIRFTSTVNWDIPAGVFQTGPISNLTPLTVFTHPDPFVRLPGNPLTIPLWSILSNDAPDAAFERLPSATTELGGTVVVSNGDIRYTPPSPDDGLPDHFFYLAQNFTGTESRELVTINSRKVEPATITFQLTTRGANLEITAEAGLRYQLEITDALGNPWTPFGSPITAATTGPLNWPELPQDGTHFYRIAILP